MSILNYFFIGSAFTFLCDILMNLKLIQNHPKMKDKVWGWNERVTCILFWPIASLIFSIAFIKSIFK
jgi:hypothetical protein